MEVPMDSFPLRNISPRGDDELATVHSAALGVYALDEVTRVAFAGLVGAIAGDAQLSLLVDERERQRHSCTTQEEVRQ
jgi:hypothetical protein